MIHELFSIPVAYAQLPLPAVVTPVSTGATLLTFICTIVFQWIFTGAILLSVALVLVAAYKYLTGQGEPATIQSANKTLMYVAVGVAVAITARAIPIIVGSFITQGVALDPCAASQPPPPPGT